VIVVMTPTGQVGGQVLGKVLDADVPVRVLARDPARLAPGVRDRVEVVTGSMDDEDALARAFAGAEAVFWLVPPTPAAESVEDLVLGFTRPLCTALVGEGVRRLVYVSSLRGDLPDPNPHVSVSLAMDELIAGTGVSHRALRMPAFMDNLLQQLGPIRDQGMFFFPVSGDRRLPTCATRDVADTAARLLLDDSWSGPGDVEVLGPEDLTFDEMAGIMSETLGRPIRYQRVPGEAYQATLMSHGMSEAWARGLVDLLTDVDRGLYDVGPGADRSTSPTTFRQWCEEVLRPRLGLTVTGPA
jgi:uncharacterized protein YbjT (DUF2867 family)